MQNSLALKEIMNNDCSEDIKVIIQEFETISNNLNKVDTHIDINLPSMLWYVKSGVGITRMLDLICDFLEEKNNLIRFSSDEKFFEFSLDYCKSDSHFTSFTRLVDTLNSYAGFKNEFFGVIRIDIDQWKHHFKEEHFADFIDYICELCKKCLIILSVDGSREDNKSLEAFLSICMRLKTAEFFTPSADIYLNYLDKFLAANNIILTDGAKEVLLKSIEKLLSNTYFDGYKTIENLANDIIYNIFSQDELDTTLTKKSAALFSEDSEYITRTVRRPKNTQRIGFN